MQWSSSRPVWVDPIDGKCPACGQVVSECTGIEMWPGSYWEPPGYGCVTVEQASENNTVILWHEAPDGDVCNVGAANDSYEGLCCECDAAVNQELDYAMDA